jgi:VanZ family protein
MVATRKFRLVWIVFGWLLVLAVTYLSLTPKPPETSVEFGDKIGHLIAYATLMSWWHQIERNACRLALLFILMGLALEILQSMGGDRQGDIFDMAANGLGVGLGWIAARFAFGWSGRKLAP